MKSILDIAAGVVAPVDGLIDLDQPIPLAPHFSWDEATDTIVRDLQAVNRLVPLTFEPRGVATFQMMERVRRKWNKPARVHSGWRCEELNARVGGQKTSQHCKFEACDFDIAGVPFVEVFDWIRFESGIPFGQLILEGIDPPRKVSWIHLSLGEPYRDFNKCRQALYHATGTDLYTKAAA